MKQFSGFLAILAVAAFTTTTIAQDEAPKCQCPSQKAQTTTVAVQDDAPQCHQCPATKASAVALQEGASTCPGTCEKGCCQDAAAIATTSTQEGECAGCPVAAAMASLPKMTFKVGEEATCCSESAAALAEKSSEPIHFVVGDQEFESKEEAFVSLVEKTEEMVNAYVTPTCCEASGTTTVAGETCACPVAAKERTELVKSAVDAIQISYKVGEESACCPSSAAALAEKSGEPIHYVVADEDTCCEMTARLTLATLRYQAAVQATLAGATPAEAAAAPAAEATQTKSGT